MLVNIAALQPLPLLLLGRPECLCFEHHFGVRVQQQSPAGEQGNAHGREQEGCGGSAWQRLPWALYAGVQHSSRWDGRRGEKVRLMSCFMRWGSWGCFKWLIHRNTLLFKMKFTGTTRNSNCFAKVCHFLLLEQELRHAFPPIFLLSASLRPFIVPGYFQDESVGSLCFDTSRKPTPPAVSTLLL